MLTTSARRVAVLVCMTAAALASASSLALGAPIGQDAGSVVIVDPLNIDREYQRGDSTSAFSLRLPEGAACPGDSANDDWRVQTFIVPFDNDLSRLTFEALRPASDEPARFRSLREVNGGIYTQQMTAPNPVAGQPGLIGPFPAFTFAYFETGTFPPGRYQIGVACTNLDWTTQRYWNAVVEFTVNTDVEPGGMDWRYLGDNGVAPAGGDGGTSDGGSSGWAIPIGIVAAVAAGAGLFLLKRHRASDPGDISRQKELV